MCLAVYLASDKPLPLVEWNEKQPKFNVLPLDDRDTQVTKQFRNPFVVYAGSHEGCGRNNLDRNNLDIHSNNPEFES